MKKTFNITNNLKKKVKILNYLKYLLLKFTVFLVNNLR